MFKVKINLKISYNDKNKPKQNPTNSLSDPIKFYIIG
jgi:hypothetical protein